MSERFAIRVDGGFELGTGHFGRCLNLANELSRRGAAVDFVTRSVPLSLRNRVVAHGHGHLSIVDEGTVPVGSAWPAVLQERDALATSELIDPDTTTIVVDHYGLDATWELAVSRLGIRVVVIDDLADRPHQCQVLLDQTWSGPQTFSRYDDLVPQECEMVLGPRYALLDPKYAALRSQSSREIGADTMTISVSFGGSDPTGETRKVVEALAQADLSQVEVSVVVGSGAAESVEELRATLDTPEVSFHTDLPGLAELFMASDLAIGAGGTTTWERLCLGVPSLVTTVAENQVPVTAALAEIGAIVWIGDAKTTTSNLYLERIEDAMRDGLPSPPPMVDGWGARRVASVLLGIEGMSPMRRPFMESDVAGVLDVTSPQWRGQLTRLQDLAAGPECSLESVVLDEMPVGYLLVRRTDDGESVEVSLDPLFENRGLGALLQ